MFKKGVILFQPIILGYLPVSFQGMYPNLRRLSDFPEAGTLSSNPRPRPVEPRRLPGGKKQKELTDEQKQEIKEATEAQERAWMLDGIPGSY